MDRTTSFVAMRRFFSGCVCFRVVYFRKPTLYSLSVLLLYPPFFFNFIPCHSLAFPFLPRLIRLLQYKMPTSLYNTQFDQEEQDSIFLSSDVLPTDALFPPELTAPFSDSQFLFENSSDDLGRYDQRRASLSSNEDSLPFLSPTNPQSMSSTSPRHSLSPLTGEPSFHPTSHSPHSHSSASPLSSSGTDDVLLARSFEGVSSGELDMFLLPEPSNDYPVNSDGFGGQKSGQSLFLPGRTEGFNGMGDEWIQNLFKDPVQGNGFDDINQQPQPQSGGFDFSQILAGLQQQSQQQPLQQLQQQVGQTIQPQMVKQEPLVKQDSWGHEQNLSNSQHGKH